MITIPKSVEYSVILISHLSKNQNKFIALKDVSKILHLPYSYLSRLATSLTSGNIIESQEGKSGGYRVKDGWQEKNFYDLLVALGENKAMVSCLGGKTCTHSRGCSIKNIWQQIETGWQQELKEIKLSQL